MREYEPLSGSFKIVRAACIKPGFAREPLSLEKTLWVDLPSRCNQRASSVGFNRGAELARRGHTKNRGEKEPVYQPFIPAGIPARLDRLLRCGVHKPKAILHSGPSPGPHTLFKIETVLWVHVAFASSALVLGAILLFSTKGTYNHRLLGWTWVILMAVVATTAFEIPKSHISVYFPYYLAVLSVLLIPVGVVFARRKRIKAHRASMVSVYAVGLVAGGLFSFLPGRTMWSLFFG